MCNCRLSEHNIHTGQILVLVLMVGCFLLAEHQSALYKRRHTQVPFHRGAVAKNAQDTFSARKLLFFRPMDINSASLEELILLPGIGEVTACGIVQFRQGLGFFLSVDELDTIDSPLKPKLLGTIGPYLTVESDF